ncbi:acyltransferase [Campylobacter lanienae]|uniref:acyltransferase n=1 Tax=Campylobacter lanienae TaxID=75658 RepID=UPI000BB3E8D9|nr:acyltransferase [Campylobacter lanienae]
MQKHIRENGNVIYGDLSKQANLKLDFKGKNNIVFFAGGSRNVNISCRGDNALIFIGDRVRANGLIDILRFGLCYIDDNSTYNGTNPRIFEAKNIIFGRDCMFSWGIWLSTCDHHLIMDSQTNDRINFSKSIYIGDHVWCGQETAILKGIFVASGAVIGAKSVVSKNCYSNTVNAGNPIIELKRDLFWLRDDLTVGQWTKEQTLKHSNIPNDNFKYTYNQNEFLSPKAIEAKLDSLNTAQEKLEFVYDAIYMNKNKNRFAYFKDMPYDIPLPKYESKFKLLKFEEMEPTPPKPTTPPQPAQPTPQEQINSLKEEINKKDIEIKNLEITNQKAQNIKNHLSYKLGNALIKAHKQWYKGGYIKFIFEAIKIKNEHKFKR